EFLNYLPALFVLVVEALVRCFIRPAVARPAVAATNRDKQTGTAEAARFVPTLAAPIFNGSVSPFAARILLRRDPLSKKHSAEHGAGKGGVAPKVLAMRLPRHLSASFSPGRICQPAVL